MSMISAKAHRWVALQGLMVMAFCVAQAAAQTATSMNCPGRIYTRKEVTTAAKLIGSPDFSIIYKNFGKGVSGRVELEAVLCRSGSVTDAKVIDSRPAEIGEWVRMAMTLARFKPAELNWHTVSQRQVFVFTFNDGAGVTVLEPAQATGRLVEELDIVGNDRLSKEEVLGAISTRPGEPYDHQRVQDDFQALLRTGNFDKLKTRMTLEDAPRGGVRLIFEVVELPLIAEISIVKVRRSDLALNDVVTKPDRDAILNEFVRRNIDFGVGRPFGAASLNILTKVVEDYYRSQMWSNVKVEAVVENLITTEVKITFKISGTNF